MSDFYINITKMMDISYEIISIIEKIKRIADNIDSVKMGDVLESSYKSYIEKTIKKITENILNEVVALDSLEQALEVIIKKYQETENVIKNISSERNFEEIVNIEYVSTGTDKRNILGKFWDWITNKDPDAYDLTSNEQEKAANDTMKQELWSVLQDEKYSPEKWDYSTIEERKQILQEYMNEVITIYGLQDVNSQIIWDSDATYSNTIITWGYYTHRKHSVTLNAKVLTDDIVKWDSYDLMETVSHELRHAYQHEAISNPTDYMVSKETIDIWEENFDNYISSGTDYEKYREQPVEVDARDFQIQREENSESL